MTQPADPRTPADPTGVDPVSLYDTPLDPPRRAEPQASAALLVDEPATPVEPAAAPSEETPFPAAPDVPYEAAWANQTTDAPSAPDQDFPEPVAEPAPEEAAEPTPEAEKNVWEEPAPASSPVDGSHIFNIQLDDVAAAAGGLARDAGDLAKGAWQRIGQFANSVIPDAHVDAPPPAPGEQPVRPTGNRGVERLVLRSVGRRVRLVGDPRVATIAADGPHTLRRQGVTLEVNTEGELGLNLDQFSVIRPPRSLEDLRVLGLGKELVVRVNPLIPVDAEVTGSRLTTVGIPYLGKIRVSAGGAELSGVVEVRDALVQAGGATISGPLSGGRSVVRVESGNLSVKLSSDASVTVRAQTQLGKVSWPGDTTGDVDEYVIGSGAGRLELGVVIGRAVVRIED